MKTKPLQLDADGVYRCKCPECTAQRTHLHPLTTDALWGAAYSARMFHDNPELSEDAKRAYAWAEAEFLRIAKGDLNDNDII